MVSCDSFFSLYVLLYSLLSEAFFFESQWRFKYRSKDWHTPFQL